MQDQPSHSPHTPPYVAAELVAFSVRDSDLQVLLVERPQAPFAGRWALPSAPVQLGEGQDQGEDLDEAAQRALEMHTGLSRGSVRLHQLGAYGRPGRDPRQRVISVAWLALVPASPVAPTGARWISSRALPPLAFDHGEILDAAIDRLRLHAEDRMLAFALLPETFTVAELREVFEAIFGATHDPANFRRRFKRLLEEGLVTPAPGRRQTRSKPAAVYRACGRV